MHWTEELARHLQTTCGAGVVGTLGTSLFYGAIPATPIDAVAVIPYAGSPAVAKFGTQGVYLEYPRAQVRVRRQRGQAGAALDVAQAAFLACQRDAVTLQGTLYHWLRPLQSPYLLSIDDTGAVEVCFNVEAEKEPSA